MLSIVVVDVLSPVVVDVLGLFVVDVFEPVVPVMLEPRVAVVLDSMDIVFVGEVVDVIVIWLFRSAFSTKLLKIQIKNISVKYQDYCFQ